MIGVAPPQSEVDVPTASAPYSLRDIEEMLGLTRAVVTGLIDAGVVSPVRGSRNEYRFSFQDAVLLRTAHQLREANIAPRTLLSSLRKLRGKLPAEIPLSGLRIKAIGRELAVRNADQQWEAPTGQLLLDFEVTVRRGSVSFLQPSGSEAKEPAMGAQEAFNEGEAMEASDSARAEKAYRKALALSPEHVDAAVNLGAMLCDTCRCEEALALYDAAIPLNPQEAHLHFNRAIALEDLKRDREALQAYQQSLSCDPELADAHYNAARLLERMQDAQGALRHYSAYRRLQQ